MAGAPRKMRRGMPIVFLVVLVRIAVTRAPRVELWCRLDSGSKGLPQCHGWLSRNRVLRMRGGGKSARTSTSPAKKYASAEGGPRIGASTLQRHSKSGADRSSHAIARDRKKKKKEPGRGKRKNRINPEAIRCNPPLKAFLRHDFRLDLD